MLNNFDFIIRRVNALYNSKHKITLNSLFMNYLHQTLLLRVTPPFWYAVFRRDLDGMQYAKGRYAVRRNSVTSYADINFYFKKVQFHKKKHT